MTLTEGLPLLNNPDTDSSGFFPRSAQNHTCLRLSNQTLIESLCCLSRQKYYSAAAVPPIRVAGTVQYSTEECTGQ
ncbi:uncharacterized protein YALI1_B11577g [Yarrowia lipolytica]|uniref:Uncharacterized protein n=1 Tax=Yarrowia lipolytica TaxID=4952 RepID=A0A1D8N726_YARLL|nr:hypothetical protein YALI1_B11577g [Yarrowia lipolytica]